MTNSKAPINTIVRKVEKSLPLMASTVNEPRPGIPKKDSSSSEPVNKNGMATTT